MTTDDVSVKHPTERAYDEHLAPLVSQLIDLAKQHGVPLFISASMYLTDDAGDVTRGSAITMICPGDREWSGVANRMELARGVLLGHDGFDTAAGLMITRFHPESKT